MTYSDSRRLTGPNLFTDRPGAVLEARAEGVDLGDLVQAWAQHARRLLAAVGWGGELLFERRYAGGASLGVTAPPDALYAAAELNEAAFAHAAHELGASSADAPPTEEALRAAIADERDPMLMALARAAAERGVALLADDEAVTVGMGAGSRTWPAGALPAPEEVDWDAVHDVPLGLVTGTNGKSTTVRLAFAVLEAWGRTPGCSTTDFLRVGGEVLDTGDWSGPGGARAVLRDRRTASAVLEVARGGLLRRGLAVTRAAAAAVTNVAADHLGEYGILDVDDLAGVKLVVRRAVEAAGLLIASADDPVLVRHLAGYPGRLAWFALDPDEPTLVAHVAAGGTAAAVRGGHLALADGGGWEPVVAVADVPVAMGGAAAYNVRNALAAALLTRAMGAPLEAVRAGLTGFGGGPDENPGRGNRFEVGGATFLVDFAHNAHGLEAVAETAAALPARRRLVAVGHAGDRTEAEVRAVARAVWALRPDRVVLTEYPEHLRGAAPGAVTALLEDELRRHGATDAHLARAADVEDATRQALAWAAPGDLALLFALSRRDAVFSLLRS